MSSFATFVASVVAVRVLDAQDLGAYALVFTAFVLAAVLPTQLVFTPAEVFAARSQDAVPQVIGCSLRLGVPVAGASAALLVPAVVLVPQDASPGTLPALLVTAAAVAVLSPVQDHVRRLLHVTHRSWAAAAVSFVHAAVTVAALAVLAVRDAPPAWLPFGALLVANALSLPVGIALLHRGDAPVVAVSLPELLASGRWLVVMSGVPALAGFVSAAAVTTLAGAAALGHAEAARVVAQPVLVVAMGMGAVLGPRSVAAAAGRHPETRRQLRRTFMIAVTVVTALWAAVVAVDWPANPAAQVLPTAYAVGGLVALTLLATAVNAAAIPLRYEMLGFGASRRAAGYELVGGLVQVGVSLSAAVTGAYARPAAFLAVGGLRLRLLQRAAAQLGDRASAPDAGNRPIG